MVSRRLETAFHCLGFRLGLVGYCFGLGLGLEGHYLNLGQYQALGNHALTVVACVPLLASPLCCLTFIPSDSSEYG